MPIYWVEHPDEFNRLTSELANSLQAALGLSDAMRLHAQRQTINAIALDAEITRAVRAAQRLAAGKDGDE